MGLFEDQFCLFVDKKTLHQQPPHSLQPQVETPKSPPRWSPGLTQPASRPGSKKFSTPSARRGTPECKTVCDKSGTGKWPPVFLFLGWGWGREEEGSDLNLKSPAPKHLQAGCTASPTSHRPSVPPRGPRTAETRKQQAQAVPQPLTLSFLAWGSDSPESLALLLRGRNTTSRGFWASGRFLGAIACVVRAKRGNPWPTSSRKDCKVSEERGRGGEKAGTRQSPAAAGSPAKPTSRQTCPELVWFWRWLRPL